MQTLQVRWPLPPPRCSAPRRRPRTSPSRSACSPICRASMPTITGPGSVLAAKMAVQDFNPGRARHEGRDRQRRSSRTSRTSAPTSRGNGSTSITSMPSSTCRIPAWRSRSTKWSREKNKVFLVSGAAISDLTGPKCSPNTVHWTYDTWMLANSTGKSVVKGGGDTWFFLTVRLRLRPCARARHHRGGEGQRRPHPRQRQPSAQQPGLLVVPAAGAAIQGQDHRPRQCRRRHHQRHQAGRRIRHHRRRAALRRPAGLHRRRRGARLEDGAGPGR